MTIKDITNDLREIKYFYSRQQTFDINKRCFTNIRGLEKVEKYSKLIEEAPLQFVDVYILLYIEGLSAPDAAEEIGICNQTFNERVMDMKKYLLEKITKDEIIH